MPGIIEAEHERNTVPSLSKSLEHYLRFMKMIFFLFYLSLVGIEPTLKT